MLLQNEIQSLFQQVCRNELWTKVGASFFLKQIKAKITRLERGYQNLSLLSFFLPPQALAIWGTHGNPRFPGRHPEAKGLMERSWKTSVLVPSIRILGKYILLLSGPQFLYTDNKENSGSFSLKGYCFQISPTLGTEHRLIYLNLIGPFRMYTQ